MEKKRRPNESDGQGGPLDPESSSDENFQKLGNFPKVWTFGLAKGCHLPIQDFMLLFVNFPAFWMPKVLHNADLFVNPTIESDRQWLIVQLEHIHSL